MHAVTRLGPGVVETASPRYGYQKQWNQHNPVVSFDQDQILFKGLLHKGFPHITIN